MGLAEDLRVTAKVSDFVEAYDFEVYDIFRVTQLLGEYKPILYSIIGIYLFAVYFGQKLMKTRPAYNLSFALFVWNIGLAVFSFVATVRALPELAYLLFQRDGFYLATCKRDVHNYATSFWGLMFLLSKIVELGDTAFIVLRKQKLDVLHWFHHVATLLICWLAFEYYETSSRFLVLNTFVHTFMYSYYALKAIKVQIPRKISRALTILQISQMLFFSFVASSFILPTPDGKPCRINPELVVLASIVIFSFTVLFIDVLVEASTETQVSINRPIQLH